jgi:hypothetical protein
MDRDTLLDVCERFARERGHIVLGRVTIDVCGPLPDPTAEILRSFRRAEISESEKNALLSLVADPDDDFDVSTFEARAETTSAGDPSAHARPDLDL